VTATSTQLSPKRFFLAHPLNTSDPRVEGPFVAPVRFIRYSRDSATRSTTLPPAHPEILASDLSAAELHALDGGSDDEGVSVFMVLRRCGKLP
jgi:hypothetical protein